MIHYVCGFYFSRDCKRVALITKVNPDWQKGKLNGVGGKVEHHESFIDAMVREFTEESGLQTHREDWSLFVSITGPDWHVAFFRALSVSNVCNDFIKADEQVAWYNVNSLPDNVLPNLRWLIPLALDGSVQTPIKVEAR